MRITYAIIAICMALFAGQSAFSLLEYQINGIDIVTLNLSLIPALALSGYIWQFVSYMFLHGNIQHLFINMFVLLIFGRQVEDALGRKMFLLLYFISGIGSAFIYLALGLLLETGGAASFTIMLGASGAIFGVLAAFGILYPKRIIFMFPGIPMPAILAVVVFAFIELFMGVTGFQPGVANFGHLGGIIFGVAVMLFWKFGRKKKRHSAGGDSFEYFWQ